MKSHLSFRWEFETPSLLRKVPLKVLDVHRCLKIIEKDLRSLKEWKQMEKTLGYRATHFALMICTEKTMRSYQKRFRGLDRSTDVLSFPALESPGAQEKGYLGDVLMSLDNVERNSRRYKCSFEEEFIRVWVHSILHLVGMDHVKVSKNKSQRMMKVQDQLIQKLGTMIYKKSYERKVTRNRK